MTIATVGIQVRQDASSAFSTHVYSAGEPVYATDVSKMRIGDGVHAWSLLPDMGGGLTTAMQSQMTSNFMSTTERGNYWGTANAFLTTAMQSGCSSVFQSTGPYLTTAMQSGVSSGFMSTSERAGLLSTSQSSLFDLASHTSAFLTTAMASNMSSQWEASSHTTAFDLASHTSIWEQSSHTTIFLTTGMLSGMTSAFQYTSATSAITSNAFATGNSSNLLATSQSSLFDLTSHTSIWEQSSHTTLFLTTAMQSGCTNQWDYTSNSSKYELTSHTSAFELSSHTTLFLTTAMGSAAGSGFMSTSERGNYPAVSAGLNLTNVSATFSSNSISLSVAAPGGGGGAALQGSGTYTQNTGTISFANSNSVTFGMSANQMTASIPAFLTTAMQSACSSNFQSTGPYLTTAMQSGMSSQWEASSHTTAFELSSHTTVFLTTAMQSGCSSAFQSTGPYLTTAMQSACSSAFWGTGNAFLTTAMASGAGSGFMSTTERSNFVGSGAAFSGTNISGTIASNSIALSVAGGGVGSTNYVQATAALNLTNVSATMNSNALSLSVAAPGGGAGAALQGSGAYSQNTGTISFVNSNSFTFGLSTNQMTASFSQSTHNHQTIPDFVYSTAAIQTYNSGVNPAITLNSTGVSLNVGGETLSNFVNVAGVNIAAQITRGTMCLVGFTLPQPISFSYIRFLSAFPALTSTTLATTINLSVSASVAAGWGCQIFTQGVGGNSRSLQALASSSFIMSTGVSLQADANGSNYSISSNITYPREGALVNYATNWASTQTNYGLSTTHLTQFTGSAAIDMPFATSLSAGNYVLGLGWTGSTTTNNGSATGLTIPFLPVPASAYYASDLNITFTPLGLASASSFAGYGPGIGAVALATNVLTTNSINMGNITTYGSNRKLFFQMKREA